MHAKQTKAVVYCCDEFILLYKFKPSKEKVLDISVARPPVKVDVDNRVKN